MESVELMGYKIFAGNIKELGISGKTTVVNTLNAYSYVKARFDNLFKKALNNSTILVPDGFSIVVASRFLAHKKIKKIAGADVFYHYCRKLNQISGKCFLLGSIPHTLSKIQEKMHKEYPNIQVASFSPPFKPFFSDKDNQMMQSRINAFSPDVLFVGMTAPKQEKWVFKNHKHLDAKVICSIGAVFDFYAETKKRAGKFWIKHNLEWLIRFLQEPRRMWKRDVISFVFYFYLIYHCIFKKPKQQ